jgi:hypothetical protein
MTATASTLEVVGAAQLAIQTITGNNNKKPGLEEEGCLYNLI